MWDKVSFFLPLNICEAFINEEFMDESIFIHCQAHRDSGGSIIFFSAAEHHIIV